MSECPLPLPPTEEPTETFGGVDEESPSESEKNMVAPERVLVREPSVPLSLSLKALREGFAVSPRQASTTLININDLPEDLAATLRPFDINNDGQISLTELIHGAMTHQEERRKVVYFRRLVLGFVLVWILTMGAFAGLVFGVVELTKESKVHQDTNGKGGASLVTTDEAFIVQTANSDFFVAADGSAYVRKVTSQDYENLEGSSSGEDAQYNVMKTSAAQANITFSSYIPDEVLMEMKSISIRSAAGAHLSLQVHGVLRMPADSSATIGAVTLLTHIGRIVIDGTAVSFYDDTDVAIFENAGFMVNGSTVGGRRLLDGILALFGIFNAVAALKDWKGENSTYAKIPPPKLPANFIMHSRRYAPCIANPNADGTVVPYPDYLGGTLPSEPGVDYCDLLGIDDEHLAITYVNNTVLQRFIETQYVIYRFGSEYLRVEYVHPLHPNVTFVEVLDNSDAANPIQFHYNVDSDTKGLSQVSVSRELDIVEFVGPIYYYNSSNVAAQNLVDQALSAPFDFLGTTMHGNKEVRIWAMHLMDNTVHAYWYDSVDTQQVQRIDYGNFGMLDVVGMTPVNDTDAAAMSFLFTQPIANLTEIVTGASDFLPYQVGINPYDPFITEYSNMLAAQSFDSNQRTSTKMFTANGEKLVVAPKHLLIQNAEARRRRHIPGSERAPESRRHSFLNEEEDPLPDMEPELSLDEADPAKRVLNQGSKELQATDRTCPTGWVAFGNMCYYFYSAAYKNNWDTCSSLCKETPGSEMLCVESAAQNVFITNAASSRGHKSVWLGMQKDSTNKLRWGSTCNSYYYNWAINSPGANMYAASMIDAGGTWVDTAPQSFSCVCQNTFAVPTTRPTAQPSSTRAPLSRPTAPPTVLVTTVRPTSAPNTLPKDKPQRSIPSDIGAIFSAVKNSFGCTMDNKCDNYYLWYDTIDAPFFPVLTATGNFMFPCVFSTGLEIAVIAPPMPVIEFAIEAGAEIAFCNDFSGIDYVYGYMSVSVGITGMVDVPVPFGQLFSWQIAHVGIGLTFYVSEMWCSVTNGVATYSSNEAYGMFRHIAKTAKGPQICRCLERGQTYPGFMQVIGGPDLPGLILTAFPPFGILSPFLMFMRITNSALIDNFPDVCSLSISRTGMTIDLVIDLAFYSYSVNVFSYQMSTATKSGTPDFIGAFMNKPKGLDAFLDAKGFSNQFLEGPFTKAGNKMKDLLDANAMVWIKVVELGGELANSAKNYFNKGVEEGKILASAAGDLYRLFKPPKVIVYGCFDPHISEPRCTKKIKVFGKRICVNWSMPQISCGSTSKCIKYC